MFKNKKLSRKISFLICWVVCFSNISLNSRPIEEIAEEKSKIKNYDFLNKDNYLLGPGDQLNIVFIDVPKYSDTYSVLTDGTIQLPLVGSVYISDKTLDDATSVLREKLKKELLRPDLYIKVIKPRPILVSVVGETKRPGVYSLNEKGQELSTLGYPTLIDAIRKSGGITQNANLKEVHLIRKIKGDVEYSKKAKLDLLDLIIGGNQSQNPYLFDGDVIKLTKATSDAYVGKNITKSNINPQFIEVQVVGAVNSPGRIKVLPDTTLTQSVYYAGGPIEWRANKGNVELIRINNNGSASLGSYRLNLSQGVSNKKNPILNDGDIINVKSNTISKFGSGLKVVTEPISGVVTVFSLFKLLE